MEDGWMGICIVGGEERVYYIGWSTNMAQHICLEHFLATPVPLALMWADLELCYAEMTSSPFLWLHAQGTECAL